MRTREDARQIYTFGYLDESGTSGNRYFGSGLLLHGPCVSGLDDKLLNEHYRELQVQQGFRLRADIAWKKVPTSPGKYLNFYLDFLRSFFAHEGLSFHALVVDTSKYPLGSRVYFGGSRNRGMDAFLYHLARSRALRSPMGSRILHFRLDRRQGRSRLGTREIAQRLRRAAREFAEDVGYEPVVRTSSVEGGSHALLHMADLLLGSVTSDLNGKARSAGKVAVLRLIRANIGRRPGTATGPNEKKFSVWHFKPKP